MPASDQIIIDAAGRMCFVYSDAIAQVVYPIGGWPSVMRASHVEPDLLGRWIADLSPVGGPKLGPFVLRNDALAAERHWIEENALGVEGRSPCHS